MWAGEAGKFKNEHIKDYLKTYDAYQIFHKKNNKDYKFFKSEMEK